MASDAQVQEVATYLCNLQNVIVAGLGKVEPLAFIERPWRSQLGEGYGRLLEGGEVFERAGVSFSKVAGASLPSASSARRPELAGLPYQALGVSLVLHPRNPYVPTVHLNLRFFTTVADTPTWWFGGGMDLTPHYGFASDCTSFHTICKNSLDGVDAEAYVRFKQACDEYFLIRHRGERRGIGGVFFDDYTSGGFAQALAVTRAVGDAFLPAYMPIVAQRLATPYGARERAHQLFRRGRYVEFNLLQDRGTLFGLQSGGQTDAILLSLPPLASWDILAQDRDPADNETLVTQFLTLRDWI